MEDLSLNEEIGRLYNKHGRSKVQKYFQRLQVNRVEIPSHGPRRAMLNFLKASYTKDVLISESFLRSDVKLGNGSQIVFSINQSDSTAANQILPATTSRLDQNDTFEMTEIGLFLWTTPNVNPIPLAQSRKLYTYNNPYIFKGPVGADGMTEAERLYSLYSGGRLTLEIGTDKIFPSLDILRFWRVPTSQEGQATTAYIDKAGNDAVTRILTDGYSSAGYPFDNSFPSITLSGNGKNKFTLNLPEGVNLAPDAGEKRDNYVTLYLRGFLCANGAKQQNKKFSVNM